MKILTKVKNQEIMNIVSAHSTARLMALLFVAILSMTVSAQQKYTIVFEQPSNGTLAVMNGEVELTSGDQVADGTELTVVPTPDEGYWFRNWQYNSGNGWTHTFTVNFTFVVTNNTAIRVNFDPYPVVLFIDKNSAYRDVCANSSELTMASYLAQVTAPANDDLHFPEFSFYGWTADTTAAVPLLISESVEVKADYTLYSVYTDGTHYCTELYSENVITDPDAQNALEIPAILNNNTTLFINKKTQYNGNDIRNYCLEYDKTRLHARWVAFRFDGDTRVVDSEVSRRDKFTDDPELAEDLRIGNEAFPAIDINGMEYELDRGHLCASNDRLFSQEANDQTFYMSNMSPQIGNFNRGSWGSLEGMVQTLGRDAAFADTLYVVKGGTLYDGNTYGTITRENGLMTVPKFYFMALLQCKKNQEGDNGYKAVGLVADQMLQQVDWSLTDGEIGTEAHLVSIRQLEQLTGIDFFHNLDDNIEPYVEDFDADAAVADWWFSHTANDTYPFVYNRSYDVLLNAEGFSTLCLAYDAFIPEGMTAYTATLSADCKMLHFTPVTGTVLPRCTGVLLKGGANGKYSFSESHDGAEGIDCNELLGTTVRTKAPDGINYVLATKNNVTAFHKYTGDYIPAHKAYINLQSETGLASISIAEVAAGVEEVSADAAMHDSDAPMYNLSGMRVNGNYHGIIIMNGKKYYNE